MLFITITIFDIVGQVNILINGGVGTMPNLIMYRDYSILFTSMKINDRAYVPVVTVSKDDFSKLLRLSNDFLDTHGAELFGLGAAQSAIDNLIDGSASQFRFV